MMKSTVYSGLVLAFALSAAANPAPEKSTPFGGKEIAGWGWVWVPTPDSTTTPVPVTDPTVAPDTDPTTTTTDAPLTPVPTSPPVTLPPGTTICIPLTGDTTSCNSDLSYLVDQIASYLVKTIIDLLDEQKRISSVLTITEVLVEFIFCLMNELVRQGFPVLDAVYAILSQTRRV